MGIVFNVTYHETVMKEDIPKLSHDWRRKIKNAIEDKLTREPETFGKPLRRSLKGYRKLRVGNYRVIFCIEKRKIRVFVIQNRSVAYKTANKRTW